MALSEEKSLEILNELIKKPDIDVADIPRIWDEILRAHSQRFAPPPPEPAKKRRTRRNSPSSGWPKGVKREAYRAWREEEVARGNVEGVTLRDYARRMDEPPPAASEPPPEAPKKEPKAKRSPKAGK